MSDQNGPKKQYKSAILRGSKWQLSAPCPTAKGKYSKLYWDMYSGNPRLVVRTNDPEDEGNEYGRITAALEPLTFAALLGCIEEAAKSPAPVKYKVECYSNPKTEQGRGEITLSHEIHTGKDAQGRVYISVIDKQKNRPVVQFFFAAPDSRYHRVFMNGQELGEDAKSVLYALNTVELLRNIFPVAMIFDHEPPPPRTGGNGGGGWKGNSGGGGWKNRNGGGGGWKGNSGGNWKNNSNSDAPAGGNDFGGDDDIPF